MRGLRGLARRLARRGAGRARGAHHAVQRVLELPGEGLALRRAARGPRRHLLGLSVWLRLFEGALVLCGVLNSVLVLLVLLKSVLGT